MLHEELRGRFFGYILGHQCRQPELESRLDRTAEGYPLVEGAREHHRGLIPDGPAHSNGTGDVLKEGLGLRLRIARVQDHDLDVVSQGAEQVHESRFAHRLRVPLRIQ